MIIIQARAPDFNRQVNLFNWPDNGLAVSCYETPAFRAGEEYFELFMWLTFSCEAVFDNAVLQTPIGHAVSASKSKPARACHRSTEPFPCFEAEPHDGGSTRHEDAWLLCLT